ncbi:MAG: ribosome small subunit-dependent GTPase A [Spirochaetaceae bacterium]|jgi:ribosome biogenesis GTPase|nr:ribosome small subunit-dependent GTPase A [Spirochaetaceae bacterium]
MKGLVIKCPRNIFTVKKMDNSDYPQSNIFYECRIKGKVLKTEKRCYNPLAPGDIVDFEESARGKGMILALEPRRNLFKRFNRKGRMTQILAANIDQVICVTSPAQPPFRPRFIDRVLVQAEASGVNAIIVLNKSDCIDADYQENGIAGRLADYQRIGYKLITVSAKSGEGIEELRSLVRKRLSVFTGQSGVGKSSLINILLPNAQRRTGALNEKYNRGNHITVLSELLESGTEEAIYIIDTPGVRQLVPDGFAAEDTALYMKEFAYPALQCAFGLSCTHTNEAGCSIRDSVESGTIHPDRYESYRRIRIELLDKESYT